MCLRSALSKPREMDREITEKAVKGRNVIGALACMEIKRGLRYSILLATMTCGSEMQTWNGVRESGVHTVEMSYVRRACEVSRWDSESSESLCEGFGSIKRLLLKTT